MRTRISTSNPATCNTQVLCMFASPSASLLLEPAPAPVAKALKESAGGVCNTLGKVMSFYTLGTMRPRRILVVGMGSVMAPDTLRIAAGHVASAVRDMNASEFAICMPTGINDAAAVQQVVEGARLALYKFDKYKASKPAGITMTLLAGRTGEISGAVRRADIISDAVGFARDVANLPANACTPATLASMARKMAVGRTKCTVMSEPALRKGGFGGIVAVGQGSRNGPRLITLEYRGGPARQKPVVLVGKAVTFDTGGISLKPGEKMDEMKFDKCGGCTVLGIIKAASAMGLEQNIIGIIPSVENMPGGRSYLPGDIIRLYGGKTAEILNTDAEGRLILADAISYAEKRYSPRMIVDFATLTGACIVALGNDVAGMTSNDDALADSFAGSSARTAESVWRLPLGDDYTRMIKSEIADIKNMGIARAAGTIVAAAFLQEAVSNTPWIHFDIAGVAWTQQATTPRPYNPRGATGFGVRLVLDYLQNLG